MSPAAQASAPITVGKNGYISGIDGMLDQISGAVMRQVKTEILPVLQNDKALQATVGSAIGKEVASPLWVIAGVVAIYLGWQLVKPPPRRSSTARRSRSSRQ